MSSHLSNLVSLFQVKSAGTPTVLERPRAVVQSRPKTINRKEMLKQINAKISKRRKLSLYEVCEQQGISYSEIVKIVPPKMAIDPIKFFKL